VTSITVREAQRYDVRQIRHIVLALALPSVYFSKLLPRLTPAGWITGWPKNWHNFCTL